MKRFVGILILILVCAASVYARDRDISPASDIPIFKVGVIGPAGQHNILSAVHADSAVSASARGALLVRNSTPVWSRLALGASGTVLRSDGADAVWAATTLITELGTVTTGVWNATPIDISDYTTLTVTAPITLTDDDVGITVAKDIVAGVGLSGGEDNVLPGADADTTLTFDATELDALTWSDGANASNIWTFDVSGTDPTVTFGDNLVTFDTVVTVEGLGTGGQTDYDLKVGDVDGSPTYGMIQIGNACIGRTSFKAGNMDLDGSMIYRNISGPVTSEIEHVFVESTGSTTRFALAKAGVGNATYNSRSMLIAGPAPADTDYVKVSYWQTNNNIFDNLACDTSGVGADLGIQNDLEVEDDIFVDSIKESTSGAGITFNHSVKVVTGKNITLGSTQWNSSDEIDGTKIKDADYGDVDVSAGGAWTVSSVQNDSVALGTDTTGNYVTSITDGLAIDGGDGGSEGATLTIAFDPTELLGSRTWGDGSTDTIVWTWNRNTGTDPTMTFGNDLVTFNGNLTAASTITGGTLTDGTAMITGGDGTGFTSLVVDNVTVNGNIVSASTITIDGEGGPVILDSDSAVISANTPSVIWAGGGSILNLGIAAASLVSPDGIGGSIDGKPINITTGDGLGATSDGGTLTLASGDSGGAAFEAGDGGDIILAPGLAADPGVGDDGDGIVNLRSTSDFIVNTTGSGGVEINTPLDVIGATDITGAFDVTGDSTLVGKLDASFTETTAGTDFFVTFTKTWNVAGPGNSTQYGLFNEFDTSTADWSLAGGTLTGYANYNKLTLNSDDMPDDFDSTWNGVYSLIEERANTHDGGQTINLNAVYGEIDYNPDDNNTDIIIATAGRFIAAGTTENVSTMIGVYADATGGDTNFAILTNLGDIQLGGDTYWVGAGTGLPFGEAHQTDGLTFVVTMTTANTYDEVDADGGGATNINATELNLVTFPDDHYLLVEKAGKYFVTYSFTGTINSVAGGIQHVESAFMVNGTQIADRAIGHNEFSATGRERNFQGHTILDLNVNDQVSLGIVNTTSSGKILTIDHLNITVTQTGGT